MRQTNEQLNNWTVVACPNEGWAAPGVRRAGRRAALGGRADVHPARRGRPRRGLAEARRQAQRAGPRALNEARLDSLHFHGGGTDLTVGLLPESRWAGAESLRFDGLPYVANMPTEEVFTTPDSRRTEGVVRSTRPLPLDGSVVRGPRAAVRRRPHRRRPGRDRRRRRARASWRPTSGAPYLGEVALVDGESRVGQTGLVYFDGLFDENAACHIAYGSCYTECLEGNRLVAGRERVLGAHRPDDRRPRGRRRRHHRATAPSCRCCGATSGSSCELERAEGPVAPAPRKRSTPGV